METCMRFELRVNMIRKNKNRKEGRRAITLEKEKKRNPGKQEILDKENKGIRNE